MSHFERNHLKDAFNVVKTMQAALPRHIHNKLGAVYVEKTIWC